MSPEDLAKGDRGKRTALHRAAAVGNIEAAKLLVEKKRYLPNAETVQKRIPLYFAATHRNNEMVTYLLIMTEDEAKANYSSPSYQKPDRWNSKPFEGESGFRILHQLILNEFYDVPVKLENNGEHHNGGDIECPAGSFTSVADANGKVKASTSNLIPASSNTHIST
ncbi:hypothetical protein TEA_007513 [Camellia sinensis var. sinensis]|uniref:Uncharacterized protein n=1 Tax=Camellia sinensis var. sinensis TaxID=542762 RepID=A0A4S4DGV9_CAMSN|nr:hypothetical protein TEA_007513 [Camellia sinensis var. sinensis]